MIKTERAGNFILIHTDEVIDDITLGKIDSKVHSLLCRDEKIISMNVVEYKYTNAENGIVLGYKARKIILLIG